MTLDEPEQRQRHTSTPQGRRRQTEAANAARRKAYAARVAMDLAGRLDDLDDARIAALAGVLLAEAEARGVRPVDPASLAERVVRN